MRDTNKHIKKQIQKWNILVLIMPMCFLLLGSIIYTLKFFGLETIFDIALASWIALVAIWWFWTTYSIFKLAKMLTNAVEELDEIKNEVRQIRKDII